MCIFDYLAILLLLLYCIEATGTKRNRKYGNGLYFLACFLMMFVVLFVDYTKAYDMSDYLMTYHNMSSSMYGTPDNPNPENEPGFGWLCKVLWIIPESDFTLIFTCKMLTFVPIFYGIYKFSSFKIGSLLLLMTMPGVWLVEIITQRQALSIALIMIAFYIFIYRERYKYWVLWALLLGGLSIFFHSTPLLVIPISLLLYYVPLNKKFLFVILIAALAFSKMFYDIFSQYFLLAFASSEDFERMTRYVEDQDSLGIGKVNMLYNVFYTLFGIFVVYYNNYKDKVHEICFKAMILGWSIYLLIGPLPNSDRATCYFFCLGSIGALPQKGWRSAFLLFFFLSAFTLQKHIGYIRQDFWPYTFIWE